MTDFEINLMQKLNFPAEAQEEFCSARKTVKQNSETNELFERLKRDYASNDVSLNTAIEQLTAAAQKTGISEYTFHLMFLLSCTPFLFERYEEEGIAEEIFWNTVADLKYKLIECRNVKGVWGTFVANWNDGFFAMTRFALGRMQFERVPFMNEPFSKGGITINSGDTVINMHIPSSGESFDKAARLDAYKRAFSFFGNGKPMGFVCSSWLLYPGHVEFLSPKSNILDFMRDFEIIESKDKDEFSDAWRVFANHSEKPPEQWPQDTSLRKAFAQRILSGKKTGSGYGIFIFDGEKIID